MNLNVFLNVAIFLDKLNGGISALNVVFVCWRWLCKLVIADDKGPCVDHGHVFWFSSDDIVLTGVNDKVPSVL